MECISEITEDPTSHRPLNSFEKARTELQRRFTRFVFILCVTTILVCLPFHTSELLLSTIFPSTVGAFVCGVALKKNSHRNMDKGLAGLYLFLQVLYSLKGNGFIDLHYHHLAVVVCFVCLFGGARTGIYFVAGSLVFHFGLYAVEELGLFVPDFDWDVSETLRVDNLVKIMLTYAAVGILYVHCCHSYPNCAKPPHRAPILKQSLDKPLMEMENAAEDLRTSSKKLIQANTDARDALAAYSHGSCSLYLCVYVCMRMRVCTLVTLPLQLLV